MKKRYIFSLAAMALLTAACSSDEMALNPADQPAPVEQKIPFTAVISADAAGTRALTEASDGKTITAKWEKEEKVALIHGETIDVLEVTNVDATTGAATISGTITNPKNEETVYVVYVGHQHVNMSNYVSSLQELYTNWKTDNPEESAIPTAIISEPVNELLATQDGTLETISNKHDYRFARSTFAVSDGTATFASEVKMPASYAIWKLNLTTDGTTALKAKKLVMKKDGKANVTIDLGTEKTSSEFYIAFIPSAQANAYAFEATTSDEKTYTCTPTVSSTLEAGKFYRSTLTMTSGNTYRVYTSGTAYTDETIPTDAVTITSTTTTWTGGKTYLVSGDVTISGSVALSGEGDVNLILKDGALLTISGAIGGGGNTLNIYGQKEGTGELSAKRTDEEPIAITAKNLNVHGGKITVPSSEQGIETGGTFTIYNGIINTTGTANGIMALGPMNVYGGEITATSTSGGAAISLYKEGSNDNCNLTIAGGKVTATNTGSSNGIYNPENIIITGGTVEVTSVGYGIRSSSITIQGGNVTTTSTGEDGIGISSPLINISGENTIVEASGSMEGILADEGTLTIEGGNVTAKAGTTTGNQGGNGIEGTIVISGGDIKATGGNAKSESNASGGAGIDGNLTVNGGTVTATGGAGDGEGGSNGSGISGTIELGSGIKLYAGAEPNPSSDPVEGPQEAQLAPESRYVIIK